MNLLRKTTFKKLGKKIQKPFKAAYSKSPILVVFILVVLGIFVLGGSSYGVYRAISPTVEKSEDSEVREIQGVSKLSEDLNDKDTNKISKTEEDSDSKTGSPQSPVTDTATNKDAESSSDQPDNDLVSTAYSINLGGPEPGFLDDINITSSSGKEINPLRVSRSPTPESASGSINFGGIRVHESADTDGTQQYRKLRTLAISQADTTTSGSATMYVFAGYEGPVAIKVIWNPRPEFYNEKTDQTMTVSGSTRTFTLNFKIVPNAYFGKPKLNFYIGYAGSCGSGSVTSINTVYSGIKNYSLTCKYTPPVCDRQPCPIEFDWAKFDVYTEVQTSGGYYIPGSTKMTYLFEW